MRIRESTIEQELIEKLDGLKYTLRPDIRDRAALEKNFRERFEALNRVTLKRQNQLSDAHIKQIVDTYRQRPEKPVERYARRVPMQEIIDNDYNLNISRYVSTAETEKEIDLALVHAELVKIDREVTDVKARHNAFLVGLGLPPLP